jgi:hypothetical protein
MINAVQNIVKYIGTIYICKGFFNEIKIGY